MEQGSMFAQQRGLPAYSGQDEFLDVDTCTWAECLLIIENHDWSSESLISRESISVDDT